MLVVPGAPEANVERACEMVRAASAAGCQVVVLPECLDAGWTDPCARETACPVPGRWSDALAAAARDSAIYVVAGLVERCGDRLHNSSLLFDPGGKLLLRHRKVNELDIALDLYSTGRALEVADTEFGTVGIPICADNFPDSTALAESMIRMGARFILSPCAWAVDADHDNVRDPYGQLWLDSYVPLARRFGVAVAGVSNVGPINAGPWRGRKCIGCSLAVAPGGEPVVWGPYGEPALVTFET
jgi:predicted amidohydrolase